MNDIPGPGELAAPQSAYGGHLQPILDERRIVLDRSQLKALDRLQRLYEDLVQFVRLRRSLFRRWLQPPVPPRGVGAPAWNHPVEAAPALNPHADADRLGEH